MLVISVDLDVTDNVHQIEDSVILRKRTNDSAKEKIDSLLSSMDGLMDGWMGGWMDRWIDGWMD